MHFLSEINRNISEHCCLGQLNNGLFRSFWHINFIVAVPPPRDHIPPKVIQKLKDRNPLSPKMFFTLEEGRRKQRCGTGEICHASQ